MKKAKTGSLSKLFPAITASFDMDVVKESFDLSAEHGPEN
jgi:hypothetical protein